jgi:hypothetical protein
MNSRSWSGISNEPWGRSAPRTQGRDAVVAEIKVRDRRHIQPVFRVPILDHRMESGGFRHLLQVHRANAENRRSFGIVDGGPIYQDIDEPNASLVHTWTEDPARAAQWFQTDVFKESTRPQVGSVGPSTRSRRARPCGRIAPTRLAKGSRMRDPSNSGRNRLMGPHETPAATVGAVRPTRDLGR